MSTDKPPRNDGFCSDCEKPIPAYICNPGGLGYISPKSDDMPGSVKQVMLMGQKAWEAIPRVVCMECYATAWNETYPDNPWPLQEISEFVHEDLDRAFRLGLLSAAPVAQQPPAPPPEEEVSA